MSSRDPGYIEDIRLYAERAVHHIGDSSFEAFQEDLVVQDAIIRCLIVIGEASRNVSAEMKAELSALDWTGMIRLRDLVVHHYRRVDLREIWTIVKRDLPPLIAVIEDHPQ